MVKKPTYEELERRIKELEGEAALRKRAEEALERRLRFQGLLSTISRKFLSVPSDKIEEEFKDALKLIANMEDIDRCVLTKAVDAEGMMRITADADEVRTDTLPNGAEYRVPWFQACMREGKVVCYSTLEELPEAATMDRSWLAELGIESMVAIPLSLGRIPVGAMAFETVGRTRTWSDEEVEQFALLAEVFSNALARKRAQDALEESEERFRAFMDNNPAAIYMKDEAGRHTYANKTLLTSFGKKLDEFIGTTSTDFFPQDIAKRLEADDIIVKTKNVPVETGEWSDTYAGEARWWKETKFPIPVSDGRTLVGGIAINITARKRAEKALRQNEKQLRLMADSLPVFISYVDAKKHYRFNNIAYEKLFGISRDEIVGHHIREILGNQVYESIRENVEIALAGEEVRYETDLPMEDGSIRHMAVTYVPHFSEEGKTAGFYSLAEDVTDRRQAEEEARRHREALFHVDRVATMGELTASLAHELNQPLSAILSNAHAAQKFLAADPPNLDEVGDALSDIVNDGLRASEVIGRLRAFLKRDVPDYYPLDLNEAVRDVITLVNRDVVIRNVSIVTDLCADLPPVLGDRIQLQQVILNLISNGIDAMMNVDADARRLIIRTEKKDEQNVQIVVRDFGIGIDEEDINRVFEPFSTTKPEGMGMGLSISRTIVEAHSGQLWATNNPDGGATFYFTLPACNKKK